MVLAQSNPQPAGEPGRSATGSGHVSLARVLNDLGSTLLHLVGGDPAAAGEVSGIVFHDPLAESGPPAGSIVFGIGLAGADEIGAVLSALGTQGAAALVVREPVPDNTGLTATIERTGVVLLSLAREASWHQLTFLLRSLLAAIDPPVLPEVFGGVPAGDLFAMADAICALIDAPITIEDRENRVLAFSGRQDEADQIRIDTILGRRVPESLSREDELRGIPRDLYRAERPLFLDPLVVDGSSTPMARVAVAVRAGDEVLGSIWAAVHQPLSPELEQLLLDASKLVALHLLRLRAGADVERRLAADLLATVLEGGPQAPAAAARLGLDRKPCVVAAMSAAAGSDHGTDGPEITSIVRSTADWQKAVEAFTLHLSVVAPGSAVTVLQDLAYAVVPARRKDGAERRVAATCREFSERIGQRLPIIIGVGRVAESGEDLMRSRGDADRALRVLRSGRHRGTVARAGEVEIESLMLDLRDLAESSDRGPSDSLTRLLAYDAAKHAQLVPTLQAWLDAHGNTPTAAAAVHVHENTFRYRLRRIGEICDIDLTDPEARFRLELELRLFAPAAQRQD